ncbi:MAG: maleylpyruvate isomerase family mycothiol-dependent enzyme [Acidimicrobiales bacterium]|jgi:uncharacterized protein (TIGR03083 family)
MGVRETLRREFDTEHADFIALTQLLTADQWAEPSLCRGWTVRDVVVHTAWHIHRDRKAVVGFLLKGAISGSAKAGANQIARDGDRSNDSLIEWIASPGHCDQVNLGEMMIHQQDVRRPLGLNREIPEDQVKRILDISLTRSGSMTLVPASRKLSQGLRLVATDIDWSSGQGEEVRGTGEAILMAISGRRSAVDDLEGSGVKVLANRMATK